MGWIMKRTIVYTVDIMKPPSKVWEVVTQRGPKDKTLTDGKDWSLIAGSIKFTDQGVKKILVKLGIEKISEKTAPPTPPCPADEDPADKFCTALVKWQKEIGKEKKRDKLRIPKQATIDAVEALVSTPLEKAVRIKDKLEREMAFAEIKTAMKEKLLPRKPGRFFLIASRLRS